MTPPRVPHFIPRRQTYERSMAAMRQCRGCGRVVALTVDGFPDYCPDCTRTRK